MEIRTGFLETRVARRIFLLFLACAVVPVLAAGTVGYLHVRSQLVDQSRERLREAAKSLGMVAFQRVSYLEATLEAAAADLEDGDGGAGLRLATTPGPVSRPAFRGLVLRREGTADRSWREPGALPGGLSPARREHLVEGGTALVVDADGPGTARILLARALAPPDLDAGVLWGVADASVLWEDRGLPSGAELCVVGPGGSTLHCPRGAGPEFRAALEARGGRGGTSDVRWTGHDREHLAGVWSLFLKGSYAAEPWTVAVSQTLDRVTAPMADFRRSFLLVLLLGLLVVLYASNVQIRRSLVPLRELRDGTRRVARGEFGTPVEVESGDEFEELAGSFNDMTRQVSRLLRELDDLAWGALLALARTIDAKSPWTSGHSERVTRLSVALGRELGLGEEELDALARGTLLHDLGKVAVPVRVLDKPGSLTAEEWDLMREHPVVGARILEPLPRYGDILPIVRHHHERWDGAGYPDGLGGEEIDPLARIVAVADAFDAMTSDRPYRDGLPVERALRVVRDEAGAQFDPRAARAFVELVEREGPDAGSLSVAGLEELASRRAGGGPGADGETDGGGPTSADPDGPDRLSPGADSA